MKQKRRMKSTRETHGVKYVSENINKKEVRRKGCHAAKSCIILVEEEMKREEEKL